MYIKDKPPAILQQIQQCFNIIRNVVNEHSNLVRITHDEYYRIVIEDFKDPNSGYLFVIENPEIKNNKLFFDATYRPTNASILEEKKTKLPFEGNHINSHLKNWINCFKIWDQVEIHPKDRVFKEYQNRILNSLQFLDDENDDKPLSNEHQIQLSSAIVFLIEAYKEEDDYSQPIVDNLEYLNKNIAALTQAQIKEKLSFGYAQIMLQGANLFKTLVNKVSQKSVDAGIGQLFIEGIKLLMS